MRGMHHDGGVWKWLRPLGDTGAAVLAFWSAFLTRLYLPLPLTLSLLPADRLRFFFSDWWLVALSQPLVLYFFGFYDPPGPSTRSELPRRLAAATALQGLGFMGYYFLANRTFPRSIVILFALFNFLLLLGWRLLLLRLRRLPVRRVAIVGAGPAALQLASAIREEGGHGLEIAGFVPAPDDEEEKGGEGVADPDGRPAAETPLGPRLGTLEDLPALFREERIDDIILAGDGRSWQTRLMDQLAEARTSTGNVLLLPGPFESLIGRMRYRWVSDLPLIEVMRQTEWQMNRPLKRTVDLVAGTVLLLLSLPLLAAAALAVRLTSPGPILYRQTRLGLGRRPFEVMKLRTMWVDAEKETGEVLAAPRDPRLTPVGGFLRRFRLDELPQLVNVLKGHMSLVGPRPERPVFVERFLADVPGYAERFTVPPGVTGLAQVSGSYHSTADNKLRYDLAYIANWSLWLDLSILLRTIKIVLTSRGL